MPNFVYTTCSKNVNNLRKNSSISCVHSSTGRLDQLFSLAFHCAQKLFIESHLPANSTALSTYKINKFNLLNNSFTHYPQTLLINPLKEI